MTTVGCVCHYLEGSTHLPVLKVILKKVQIRKRSVKLFYFSLSLKK